MGIEEWIDEKIDKYDKVIKLNNEALSFAYSRAFLGENRTALKVIEDLQQLKASLPTQPELVEVPKVTGVMIDYFKREGFSLHESLNLHVNVPNTLSLVYKEFREWLTADDYATKEDIFARAWLDGYTVKKEQLYYVKVGNLAFVDWEDSFVAKLATTDSPAWTNYAHKIPTKDGADNIARIIGGEAVPVDQEQKLPQEVEVSEYLKEEE